MEIRCRKSGDTLYVAISGELDHHNAAALITAIDKVLMDMHILSIEFDMKNLKFMDSSGVGALIGRYKIISKRGGMVTVKNTNSQINKIMSLTGLYDIIKRIS